MRRSGVILLAFGCAAFAAAQDAPLAGSKKQLQQLGKDRAADEAKAQSGLKLGELPQLQAQPRENAAPTPTPPQQNNQSKAQDDSRNWLLQGYDRLGKRPEKHDKEAEHEGAELLDPRSPDYFLKVYERQRTNRQVRMGEGSAERLGATPTPDAWTPLMQDWLARSPVKGILKDTMKGGPLVPESADSLAAKGDAPVQAATAATQAPWAETNQRLAETRGVGVTSQQNPYVQALGIAPERGAPAALALPSPTASLPPAVEPPTAPIMALPELPKVESRRGPPPSPADDKKYFPQLKKF